MNDRIIVESFFELDDSDRKKLCGRKPEICCCESFALMLHSDGRVSFIDGCNTVDVSAWKNVIKLCAGKKHIAALTADGRVLCAGDNSFHQCETAGWTGIADIFAGDHITFGIDPQEDVCTAGSFSPLMENAAPASETRDNSEAKGNSNSKNKSKNNPPYRMPSEDISDYGTMVDFTNKILGI